MCEENRLRSKEIIADEVVVCVDLYTWYPCLDIDSQNSKPHLIFSEKVN